MKYLITDPCYIFPKRNRDKWVKFLEDNNYGFDGLSKPCAISDVGVIIEMDRTANGDGECTCDSQRIGVDAGLVCVIAVPDDFKLRQNDLGAIAYDLETTAKYYAKARAI